MQGRVLSEEEIKLAKGKYKRYEYEMVYCGSDMSDMLDKIIEQDATIRDRDKTIAEFQLTRVRIEQYSDVKRQNTIMREALEWYANASDYELVDSQYRASEALAKVKDVGNV